MIYVTMPFLNELDLLEVKLSEEYEFVDKFIIVESNETFIGKNKEYIFEANKSRFEKYLDKITYLKISFPDNITGVYDRDNYSKEVTLLSGIEFKDEDILIVTDVDEVVNFPNVIAYFKGDLNNIDDHRYRIGMYMCYYYLNTINNHGDWWWCPYIARYKTIKDYNKNIGICRNGTDDTIDIKIPNGGWHFSYLGNVEDIQFKLECFNYPRFDEVHIQKCIGDLKDLYGRGGGSNGMHNVYIDNNIKLPATINKNLEFWQQYIKN